MSQNKLLCLIVFEVVVVLFAVVAQLVEHVIGNDEVIGSIPINGSSFVLLPS